MYNYSFVMELLATAEESGKSPELAFKRGIIPSLAQVATSGMEGQREEESLEAYYGRVAEALELVDVSSLNHVAADMRQVLASIDADLQDCTESVEGYVSAYEKSLNYAVKTNAIVTSHENATVEVKLETMDFSAVDNVMSKEFLLDTLFDLANMKRSSTLQSVARVKDYFIAQKINPLNPPANMITEEVVTFLTDSIGEEAAKVFASQVNNIDSFKLTPRRMLADFQVNNMSAVESCLKTLATFGPGAKVIDDFCLQADITPEHVAKLGQVKEYVTNVCELAAFVVHTANEGVFSDTLQYPNGKINADLVGEIDHRDIVRHTSVMYNGGPLPATGVSLTSFEEKKEYVQSRASDVEENDKVRYENTLKQIEFSSAQQAIASALKDETDLESSTITSRSNSMAKSWLENKTPMDALMYGIVIKQPLTKKFYSVMSSAYAEELKNSDSLDEKVIAVIDKKITSKFITDSLLGVYTK